MRLLLKSTLVAVLLAGSAVGTISSASAHEYNSGYDQDYRDGGYRHGDYRDGNYRDGDRYEHNRYRHRDHYRYHAYDGRWNSWHRWHHDRDRWDD